MKFSKTWAAGVAGVALATGLTGGAAAQERSDGPITTAEDIVITGEIGYRDRSDETAPVLEYGVDYFQRFEPLTAGDALKRVPSVAFLSDVLESDGVRLRGLDPAYTQILINGEQVPGSGAGSGSFGNGVEGSFFVDRIPAELIERVEVVRSQSANRSGDAIAGALNIVLRDAYALEGGYVRGGVQYWANDENWGETLGGVWGGQVGPGRLLVGANMQDRHNPKDKLSLRYDFPGGTLENSEVQTDVRDGTDYSANLSYEVPLFGGDFAIDGFYVHTDRYEDEDSIEYLSGLVQDLNILTHNDNNVDITQDSYSINTRYTIEMLGGETRLRAGFASFSGEEDEIEDETEFRRDANPYPEADRFTRDLTRVETDDEEMSLKIEHERDIGGIQLEFGLHYQDKERDNLVAEDRTRFNLAGGTNVFGATPPAGLIPAPDPLLAIAGGDNTITRERLDPYLMFSGGSDSIEWEAGLRYETTDVAIVDRTAGGVEISNSNETLLPSAHVRFNLNEDDRIFLSLARTLRNPSFSFLSPAVLEAELGDNDFVGNPQLKPETAWGVDVGYERRLGRIGVAGVNVFYRDVSDVIEVFSTGAVGSEGPGTFVYSARNVGDGAVWGVEVDFSAPLTVIGLENTGAFLNFSWLDSDVDDEFGSRTFNDQAESIFNIGFIHDMPTINSSFGVTYRAQGDAQSRVVGEEIATSYSADLEAFIEHRFGERFTLRLTGSNLLDASKDEFFNKFDTTGDQISRSFAEYEVESESAGPVFQLVGRYAF